MLYFRAVNTKYWKNPLCWFDAPVGGNCINRIPTAADDVTISGVEFPLWDVDPAGLCKNLYVTTVLLLNNGDVRIICAEDAVFTNTDLGDAGNYSVIIEARNITCIHTGAVGSKIWSLITLIASESVTFNTTNAGGIGTQYINASEITSPYVYLGVAGNAVGIFAQGLVITGDVICRKLIGMDPAGLEIFGDYISAESAGGWYDGVMFHGNLYVIYNCTMSGCTVDGNIWTGPDAGDFDPDQYCYVRGIMATSGGLYFGYGGVELTPFQAFGLFTATLDNSSDPIEGWTPWFRYIDVTSLDNSFQLYSVDGDPPRQTIPLTFQGFTGTPARTMEVLTNEGDVMRLSKNKLLATYRNDFSHTPCFRYSNTIAGVTGDSEYFDIPSQGPPSANVYISGEQDSFGCALL